MRLALLWSGGGGLDLAPADDAIIKIQKFLGIESIDKFVSSILAKKIAQGVNHVIFDVPVGKGAKIDVEHFDEVKTMFESIGAKFGINVRVHRRDIKWLDGNAVGPSLECKEFLKVYEQVEDRSLQLEHDAVAMAGDLLELLGKAAEGQGFKLAQETLLSGKAEIKLRQIIKAQGGDPEVGSSSLELGGITYEFKSKKSGILDSVNNQKIFEVAKALGNPRIKEAGLYFHVKQGQQVQAGETLVTLYATSDVRLALGRKVIDQEEIFGWAE